MVNELRIYTNMRIGGTMFRHAPIRKFVLRRVRTEEIRNS